MDIKDVEVGMLVQLNSPYQQGVGTVECITGTGFVQVRLEGVVTASVYNTPTIKNRWRACVDYVEPYQDPEADMVVWDALEVGEHFIDTIGQEAVKITKTHCVYLGSAGVYTVVQSRKGQLTKYKLV